MVAIEPATAVAMGWCPASLPPSASFASSYVAKYKAWAGLQAVHAEHVHARLGPQQPFSLMSRSL